MMCATIEPSVLERLLQAYENHSDARQKAQVRPLSGFAEALVSVLPSLPNDSLVQRTCKPGEILFEEGSPGDAIYIVRSGTLAALKGSLSDPLLLSLNGPGQVIGEMAVLEDQPRSASIVALTHTQLHRIRADVFQSTLLQQPSLSHHPSLTLGLFNSLSARLRNADHERSKAQVLERHLVSRTSQLSAEKTHLEALQAYHREMSHLLIHDIRTPLNAISLSAELLRATLSPEHACHAEEALSVIRKSVQSLEKLVTHLLDTARMETDMLLPKCKPLHLPATISRIHTQMSPLAAAKQIRLRDRTPSSLPLIHADEEILERVFVNLVDNAVKYTPEGGIVTIYAHEGQDQVIVSVEDTGPGIPKEQRPHIFNRFAQLERHAQLKVGYGMGLRFCQLAIQAHQGEISVGTAQNGQGSRFTVALPRHTHPISATTT